MAPSALKAHLHTSRKFVNDIPPKWFPWSLMWLLPSLHQLFEDCSYTHYPWDKIPPQIKSGGFKSGECATHSISHFLLISLSSNRSLSQAKESFDVWGWPHLARTTVHLDLYLCVVPMIPNTSSVLPHSDPCSPFELAHFHSQTNMVRWCHVSKWIPMLCTLLSATASARHSPVELYPTKHYSWCSHVLTAEHLLRLRTRHDPKSQDCLRSCHKTIDTWLLVFQCPPV